MICILTPCAVTMWLAGYVGQCKTVGAICWGASDKDRCPQCRYIRNLLHTTSFMDSKVDDKHLKGRRTTDVPSVFLFIVCTFSTHQSTQYLVFISEFAIFQNEILHLHCFSFNSFAIFVIFFATVSFFFKLLFFYNFLQITVKSSTLFWTSTLLRTSTFSFVDIQFF